jgi:hypothetical protein
MRALLVAIAVAALAPLAAAGQATVTVESRAYATRCAEEDNVFVTLTASRLASFRVEGAHPSYIGELRRDSFDPDFTDCHFGPTPPPGGPLFTPRQWVLWENAEWRLVANTDRHFWRARDVPVRIGDRTESNVHLLQFYRLRPGGGPDPRNHDQVVVLYPPDGHWRLKPLPVPHLGYGVYGTSLLLGPLEGEDRRRPFVDVASVVFDPATLTFRLTFARGGSATMRVAEISRERTALEVAFDADVPLDRPFAAIRSMFVTADNSDTAQVVWRGADGAAHTNPILDFTRADVREVRFARSVVSRHNSSAPDTLFSGFAGR